MQQPTEKPLKEQTKWNNFSTQNSIETNTFYGTANEEASRLAYVAYMQQNGHPQLQVTTVGLVISEHSPWLAASPDGRVLDPSSSPPDGLIELKNPSTAKDMTIKEASEKIKGFCIKSNQGQNALDTNHDYFYQVKCQLYRTQTAWCDFVIRNKELSKQSHRSWERNRSRVSVRVFCWQAISSTELGKKQKQSLGACILLASDLVNGAGREAGAKSRCARCVGKRSHRSWAERSRSRVLVCAFCSTPILLQQQGLKSPVESSVECE